MTKTATKMADAIEFSAFDAGKTNDQFRAFAEKGMEQSKEAYAKMKTAAEEAQKTVEATFETSKAAAAELTLKSVAAMRTNTEAGFAHVEALVSAKSFSEVLEIQGAFMRKSYETMFAQAKDMQSVTTKVAEEVAKPIKSSFEKSFKDVKFA